MIRLQDILLEMMLGEDRCKRIADRRYDKPSVTISVKDEEWPEVGAWVWKHFDEISGVSFLPHSNHTYQQAPYEDCTKDQFEELASRTPTAIVWENFIEAEDNTTGQQTLACTAGSCEI